MTPPAWDGGKDKEEEKVKILFYLSSNILVKLIQKQNNIKKLVLIY